MIWEIAVAILLGLLAGTLTGMIPGIHTNLLALILVASLASIDIPVLPAAIFVISMAITHTFVSFIPSVFLGAPEEDTFLSVLPGHQMLKEGKAHEAIVLTLYGSAIAILIIILFTPIFIFSIPKISNILQNILPFILIFISLFLIFREEKILPAISIFILAGVLGFASLNLPIRQSLLPLLTGLFGSSALIISIKNKVQIPSQETPKLKEIKIPKKDFFKALFGSIISAPLCSFLPGVGAGHAAIIGSELIEQSKKGFIILLGAINTIVVGLSIITLYSIGRTRTGAAVAINEILPTLTLSVLILLLLSIVISGILSFFISFYLSKTSAKYISKINYTKISLAVLIFLSVLIMLISSFLGFIVFITSTALGIFTIVSGARRINLMGCLLLPTILFYLF